MVTHSAQQQQQQQKGQISFVCIVQNLHTVYCYSNKKLSVINTKCSSY